ncbi:hypothetical protein EJ06DRAFT_558332 [Trichodelitschia bisporula]|uniref:G-protein coupled receptors family 2 profile 2 domain-containing protein n=1 Tax=Trichodelitschia bisporula TaxID=703511 RepID=A0A6G1HR22_9PEZI|nr:hypothetical protein EJ06DRAFT_558332 [Trichodelitschia bisporula]
MANISSLIGCPKPFLDAADFSSTGYIAGRFCNPVPGFEGLLCCLPCPADQWMYEDDMVRIAYNIIKLSIFGLIVSVFLLTSWAVLPPDKSHRHYLSVGVVSAVALFSLGEVIAVPRTGSPCHDAITPKDMHTSVACAWTGLLFVYGALSNSWWVLMRMIWIHLRICWDRTPGPRFFWISQTLGFGLPAVLLVAGALASGFSYRFGPVCFLNHENAFPVFWGWMIAAASLACIIQGATVVYCVRVYMKSHRVIAGSGAGSGGVTLWLWSIGRRRRETDVGVAAGARRRQWRHIQRVLHTQWRSIVLTAIIMWQGIFFAAVFVMLELEQDRVTHSPKGLEWGLCLIINEGDKNKCLHLAHQLVMNKNLVLASLAMAALTGVEILLLVRSSLFTAWWILLRNPAQYIHTRGWTRSHTPPPHAAPPPKPSAEKAELGNISYDDSAVGMDSTGLGHLGTLDSVGGDEENPPVPPKDGLPLKDSLPPLQTHATGPQGSTRDADDLREPRSPSPMRSPVPGPEGSRGVGTDVDMDPPEAEGPDWVPGWAKGGPSTSPIGRVRSTREKRRED